MKNFISVTLPSRKAKRAVLEKMLRAVNAPLNEKKSNFGIFEGVGKNIILKLEISKQLSESQSDKVAHSLSEGLFGLGYNDFDIEVSTDGTDKQILSDTDWHVNELDTLEAAGAGTEEALMAIVTQYAKPGITLANVDAMERAAAGSEPEGDGVIGMFTRFARSKRWRVNYVLAKVSELQGLPGLFNSKLTFCFMATPGDNSGNHVSQGGVTSSVGASFGQMLTLAKVGLMPENKLAKLTKAWSYDSKQMIKVKEIISAQQAATSQAVAAPAAKAAVATDTRKGDGSATDAMTAANQAKDRATGKFDNLDEKAATELYFKKLKRLDQLLKANPEARSVSVEESKKLLLKKLHNNYIFEDAAADKEIADLVADIEALSPKVSAPNKRLSQPLLKQAQPYLRRHKSITPPGKVDTTTKVDTTKRDERICAVGNPLAIFAKSGKGGLKNDPDEIAAVIELQKYLGVAPNGKYGSATKSAVTAYQKQHGLKVDSDAGPETIGHMMKQCKAGKPAPYQAPDGSASSGIDGPADAAAAAKAGDKSNTVRRPAISTEASDGVAPADEQTNDKVIKFNWKKNSYYIDVIKVEITPENKIAWTFYRDEGMTNPQKVDILAQYWILRIEKELERRAPASPAAKDALEIIAPITRAPDAIDGSASTGIDGPVVTGKANDTDAGTDAEAPGDAGYYRIPDAMREDLGLDTGKPKYVKLTLSKNGKIFYIYHNPDGTGSGPTIAVDSEEGKKITDFLKDQGAKIIDPSGNTDDNSNKKVDGRPDTNWAGGDRQGKIWDKKYGKTHNPDGTPKKGSGELDNEPNAGDGGGKPTGNNKTLGKTAPDGSASSGIDGPVVTGKAPNTKTGKVTWREDAEEMAVFDDLDDAMANRNKSIGKSATDKGRKLKKGDMCRIGDEKAMVLENPEGKLYFVDKDGNLISQEDSGKANGLATDMNKKIGGEQKVSPPEGSASTGTAGADVTGKAKGSSLTKEQLKYIDGMAENFWKAGKWTLSNGGTNEKEFSNILGKLDTAEQYAALDAAFKALKQNEGVVMPKGIRKNNVSLEDYARSEMQPDDMEEFFYSALPKGSAVKGKRK